MKILFCHPRAWGDEYLMAQQLAQRGHQVCMLQEDRKLDGALFAHGWWQKLRSALRLLEADGTLVVSMPLPYDPCWYDGPRTADPLERLPLRARGWETAAVELAEYLEAHGGRVVAMTRAPYLSGGDRQQDLYVLDAVVMVLAYK